MTSQQPQFLQDDGTLGDRPEPVAVTPSERIIARHGYASDAQQAAVRSLDPLPLTDFEWVDRAYAAAEKGARKRIASSNSLATIRATPQFVLKLAAKRDELIMDTDRSRNLTAEGKGNQRKALKEAWWSDVNGPLGPYNGADAEFRKIGRGGSGWFPKDPQAAQFIQTRLGAWDGWRPDRVIDDYHDAIRTKNFVYVSEALPKLEVFLTQSESGSKKHWRPYARQLRAAIELGEKATATEDTLARKHAIQLSDKMREELRGYVLHLDSKHVGDPIYDPERGGVDLIPSFRDDAE